LLKDLIPRLRLPVKTRHAFGAAVAWLTRKRHVSCYIGRSEGTARATDRY